MKSKISEIGQRQKIGQLAEIFIESCWTNLLWNLQPYNPVSISRSVMNYILRSTCPSCGCVSNFFTERPVKLFVRAHPHYIYLHMLYFQCANSSIIVRLHDQGASIFIFSTSYQNYRLDYKCNFQGFFYVTTNIERNISYIPNRNKVYCYSQWNRGLISWHN